MEIIDLQGLTHSVYINGTLSIPEVYSINTSNMLGIITTINAEKRALNSLARYHLPLW